jgi:hypothetical protein
MTQVVDRTIDRLQDTCRRLAAAATFREALALQGDKEKLERDLKASLEEVNRFTRGWHYMPVSG